MKKMGLTWICLSLVCLGSCGQELVKYERGDVRVCIEQGEEWLHDFPLFLGMKRKNPPQIAVWLEDVQGNYLSAVYVSHKIATGKWQGAGGNRRKEALPHWCYSRGVVYGDGLYLPTKGEPLADGISGATPRSGFDVKLRPAGGLNRFVVKVEINHSADFNGHYPKSAGIGDVNYSGGKGGSGQPAVVYSVGVDLSSGNRSFDAVLVGHSSPDGTAGGVDPDVSGLTTALQIVKRITVQMP